MNVENNDYPPDEDIIPLSDIEKVLCSEEYSSEDDLEFPIHNISMIASEPVESNILECISFVLGRFNLAFCANGI